MRMVAAALLLAACTVRHDGWKPLASAARDGDTKAIATRCARGEEPYAPSGSPDPQRISTRWAKMKGC